MVEVGPGLGVLTRRLLEAGASVVAVELDPRLATWLRRELGAVEASRWSRPMRSRFDPARPSPGEQFKLVANIPYHITSPLLHGFLEGERPPELVVLLVQAEVAERVAAAPGQMSYLSVFAQNVAEVDVVTRVPAAAFEPAPERRFGRAATAPSRRSGGASRRRSASRSTGWCRPASGSAANSCTTHWAVSWARTARDSRRPSRPAASMPEQRAQTLTLEQWACLLTQLGPVLGAAA